MQEQYVTSPIVNCMPGFDRGTTYNNHNHHNGDGDKWATTSTGTEYLMVISSPRFAIANPIKVKAVA